MASYKNFQSDNAKYSTKEGRNNHNASLNSTVQAKGYEQYSQLKDNLEGYTEFISWARFYPDLFLDLIKPEKGGIKLHSDQRMFIRMAMRFLSMYGVFTRGWGKCVSGDTYLFTDKGVKPIGEFFDYQNNDSETYYLQNINVTNRYGVLENTDSGIYSGYKDTKKIQTYEGYEIESTLNHPLLTIDERGKFIWKMAKDFKENEYILINRNNNVWGNSTKIEFDMDKYYNTLNNVQKAHYYKCNLPEEIDEEMALILGYLVGDGCLTRNEIVILTNTDTDIINRYTNFIENRIGLKVHKKSKIDYKVNSKYFREYLKQIGFQICDASKKRIPELILNSPKNIVSKFLQGLFDADGGMCKDGYFQYCTKSERLAKQVQTLLLNFGIISYKRIKYNKVYKTYAYIISIYSNNLNIYLKEIGFSCKRKQDLLIEACEKDRNTNRDLIPNIHDVQKKYYNELKKYNKSVWEKFDIWRSKNLTYKKLDYILNLDNSNKCESYQVLKEIQDTNYFYAKIKTIKDDKNHVYDLVLPDTNSFISNGFVSHNTFNEVVVMFIACVLYPGIEFALTAQTKENAAELLKDKYNDITKKYPWFKNEIFDQKFSKNDAEIKFLNGSRIDILANSQTSKGQRRNAIMIEESALLDDFTFQDALFPIVEHGRLTAGKLAIKNPEELDQKVNFYTTAGFRGSDEFERSLRMVEAMENLEGKVVLGSDWRLGCWYGRGSTKQQILDKKKNSSPVAFAQNYESHWVGASDNQLVDINKLLNRRNLSMAKSKSDKDSEVYMGVDVARSQDSSNNQSSISIIEVKRNESGRIIQLSLINLLNISNSLNFTAQAVEIKKMKNIYNAKVVCIDSNGLGIGLVDELLKESFDPITGESLGCWDTINTENCPESKGAEPCVFDLKPQSANSDIIVTFIDMVESGKLRLLEKKQDSNYNLQDKENYTENIMPFIQTDLLIEEISNLQLKHLPSGKLSIIKVQNKINKDRVSSLMYVLWYIKTYEDNIEQEQECDYSKIIVNKASSNGIFGGGFSNPFGNRNSNLFGR